jgi:hypothetical protein
MTKYSKRSTTGSNKLNRSERSDKSSGCNSPRRSTRSKRSATPNGSPLSYLPNEILQSYGKWLDEHFDRGWDGYFFRFVFKQLPGSLETQVQQMYAEISKVYARLATRVVRNPRSRRQSGFLPKGVFFPDFPVPKRGKHSLIDVSINNGLHMHGIVLAKRTERLRESLWVHFSKNMELYLTDKIQRIRATQITVKPEKVAEYSGKALKRRRISTDHILVLPRSIKELPTKSIMGSTEDRRRRTIKAIQASSNVSDQVALGMYETSLAKRRERHKNRKLSQRTDATGKGVQLAHP